MQLYIQSTLCLVAATQASKLSDIALVCLSVSVNTLLAHSLPSNRSAFTLTSYVMIVAPKFAYFALLTSHP